VENHQVVDQGQCVFSWKPPAGEPPAGEPPAGNHRGRATRGWTRGAMCFYGMVEIRAVEVAGEDIYRIRIDVIKDKYG